jgi:CRP-like cAMP-binding protein
MAIMNPREVLDKVRSFPLLSFAEGEPVIFQATATGRLLFLNEGAVDVGLEDTFIARVAEPGSVFGDLAFLLAEARRRVSETDQRRGVLTDTLDRIGRALQTHGPR